MRNSNQRNIILEIVQETHSHPTADWVYSEARKQLPNISLGTVYRNLGQLVDNQILKTVDIEGVTHYDAFLSSHQHFQCQSCNRVYDIEINTKEFVSDIDTKTNHKIDKCQIRFIGICEECKNN